MANRTLKEHILEALEDLRKDQLERFKSKLNVVNVKRGYRQIPWLILEEAMPLTLAEIIVNSYREEYGARLTAQILREINEMRLADRLLEALRRGRTSGEFRPSAAKRLTAAKTTLQRSQKCRHEVQCGDRKTRRLYTKKHKTTSRIEGGSREETGKQSGGALKEGELDAAGTSGSATPSQMLSQAIPWARPSPAAGTSGSAAPSQMFSQATPWAMPSPADGASGNPMPPAANILTAAKAAPKKRQKREHEDQCGDRKTRRPYTKKHKTTCSSEGGSREETGKQSGGALKEGQLDSDGASGNPMPPAANILTAAKAAPKKGQKRQNEAQCGDKKTRRPYTKKHKTTSSSESGSREETGKQSGGALKEGQLDAAGTSGSAAPSQMFSQATPWAMPSPAGPPETLAVTDIVSEKLEGDLDLSQSSPHGTPWI